MERGGEREGERHAAKDHESDSNPGRLRQGLSLCSWGARTAPPWRPVFQSIESPENHFNFYLNDPVLLKKQKRLLKHYFIPECYPSTWQSGLD